MRFINQILLNVLDATTLVRSNPKLKIIPAGIANCQNADSVINVLAVVPVYDL